MTKRDLFKIVFKLLGLYMILVIVTLFPTLLLTAFYGFDLSNDSFSLLIIAVLIGLVYLLLFKSDFFIDKLKLDKGFDNSLGSSDPITEQNLVRAGLIIICIYFMIAATPGLIQNIFFAFKEWISSRTPDGYETAIWRTTPNYNELVTSAVQFCVSFLVLTNKDKVLAKIEKLN